MGTHNGVTGKCKSAERPWVCKGAERRCRLAGQEEEDGTSRSLFGEPCGPADAEPAAENFVLADMSAAAAAST